MAKIPYGHGVRKINERLLQDGRTLVYTEEDANQLDWSEIPDGSLKVNKSTGIISVKLSGETDWVPANRTNDGTLMVARDNLVAVETFTITSTDRGNNEFTYTNSDGAVRRMPKTADGGYVFELEKGSYQKVRSHLEVTIDDILHRDAASGSLSELTEKRFAIYDELAEGMKITARYARLVKIGNPYPRVFISDTEPETAENGDIWIDTSASLDDDQQDEDALSEEKDTLVSFGDIIGKPNDLAGYGITDNVSYEGHVHSIKDLTDFPVTMIANGGYSDYTKQAEEATHASRADRAEKADEATQAKQADSALTAANASFADHANLADIATTARHAERADVVKQADFANKSSYAESAGHAKTADSVTNSSNAEHAKTADTATSALRATRADLATNATHAVNADTAATANVATTATSAATAQSAETAKTANTASYAVKAKNAQYADNAGFAQNTRAAVNATNATEAAHAQNADLAKKAVNATEAEHAKKTDEATHAKNADLAKEATHSAKTDNATHAVNADKATNADLAVEANHAKEATHAAKADNAAKADKATNADNSTKLNGKELGLSAGKVPYLMSDGRISPANLCSHTHTKDDIVGGIFYKGMIMQWYGNADNPPTGWKICDGTNGTPDLRDRFLVGAGKSYGKGATGGTTQNRIAKSNLPAIGIGRFSANTKNGGRYNNGDGAIVKRSGSFSSSCKNGSGDSWGAEFMIDLQTGFNDAPMENRPPYMALYFIMYTG